MKWIWLVIAVILVLPGMLLYIPIGLWPAVPTLAILPWSWGRIRDKMRWMKFERQFKEEV